MITTRSSWILTLWSRPLFWAAFFICGGLISGCTSNPVAIENVRLPFTSVSKIVHNNIPIEVRAESPNGRTLTSGYFSETSIDEIPLPRSTVRAYAVVTILGSSRPFNLDVHAYRQTRIGNNKYSTPVEDKDLTQKVVERLKSALADRREDRNAIDDIRPY